MFPFVAQAGKIKHSLVRVPFADINKHLEKLRDGDIVGRAVVTFAETAEPRREKEMVALYALEQVSNYEASCSGARLPFPLCTRIGETNASDSKRPRNTK
jgi:hypothetical protein